MSIEVQQHKLPAEVYFKIAENIEDDKDLVYFAATSRLFRAVVDSNQMLYLRRLGVYDFAFGKAKWSKYFGDIGEEPPLPANIVEILNSPCPIWGAPVRRSKRIKLNDAKTFNKNKKIKDTHMLTLVPSHVDGEQLTLESLGELVKSPKGGGNATKYDYWRPGGNEKAHVKQNTWVLMTRDVLPYSGGKGYKAQCQLVAKLAKSSGQSYEMPHLIEAVTSIFMEYVKTGNWLYGRDPLTYTRCQEKTQDKVAWPMFAGAFDAGGLFVRYFDWDYFESSGVGCQRKFQN